MADFFLIILTIIVGSLIGSITGLLPGIHVNMLASILAFYSGQENMYLAILVVSLSIVHAMSEWIPNTLLNIPTENTYILQTRKQTNINQRNQLKEMQTAGFIGSLLIIGSLIWIIPLIEKFQTQISSVIIYILLGLLALLLFDHKTWKSMVYAWIVILLSGFFGLLLLGNTPMRDPLLPSVTGFFGVSQILFSLYYNKKTPTAEIKKVDKKTNLQSIGLGSLAGLLVGIVPSITIGENILAINKLTGKIKKSKLPSMVAAASMTVLISSFLLSQTIGLARTGQAVLTQELLGTADALLLVLATILIALGIGYFLTQKLGSYLFYKIKSHSQKKILLFSLLFLIAIINTLTGLLGLLVMMLATCIGLIPLLTKTRKSNSMGFLLIPTIKIYLGM